MKTHPSAIGATSSGGNATEPPDMITAEQIRSLQATRRKAGIDDEAWADRLARTAGVRSTKALTRRQASSLLEELRKETPRPSAMSGPYAAKVRAMWIAGYHLGVVRDRSDRALLAFVERQTGLKSASWLREASQARRVVEALKAWIFRERGVDLSGPEPKRAVAWGIFEQLVAAGAFKPFAGALNWDDITRWANAAVGAPLGGPSFYTDEHWDELAAAAGRKLRAAVNRRRG
jgi:hypothetical protein